jgi:two-component system, OmpR family, sensor histidine kinase CiaH
VSAPRKSPRRRVERRNLLYAVRVAGIAAALTTLVYICLLAVLDLVVNDRLGSQITQQVSAGLAAGQAASRSPGATMQSTVDASQAATHSGLGIYGAPVFLWQLGPGGTVLAAATGAPHLAPGRWTTVAGTASVTIAGQSFEVAVGADGSGWLVAGESLAELQHVRSVLTGAELLAYPALLLVVFLGALAVAVRAVAPVEEARRRQLEFTADASHELRTPLSVLEAEVSLAKSSPRDAAHYEQVLDRVARETSRLTRIVEDLLWLARFDAQPAPPRPVPIELGGIAEACSSRFEAVARRRSIRLSVTQVGDPARIAAPADWIDRLAGVLVDNACRHAPEGGTVRILVGTETGRALLAVEDDGPGIPPDLRAHLFDRFSRASATPGGHGLGLAIADSIVRSTGGRWRTGDSELGGARMEVTWPRA